MTSKIDAHQLEGAGTHLHGPWTHFKGIGHVRFRMFVSCIQTIVNRKAF